MKLLWEDKEVLALRIKEASHIILFTDYDGTLTPIVSTLDEALLPPRMRAILKELSSSPSFSLAIISGRPLNKLKELINIDNIYYAGNHGLEIEGMGLNWVHPGAVVRQPLIQKLSQDFTVKLKGVKGLIIENKGLTFSIHFRLVEEGEIAKIEETLKEMLPPWQGEVKLRLGEKVYEVRPNIDWDKGKTVSFLRERLSKGDSELIYLGDDLTDEDAFRAISGTGIGIYIGDENPQSIAPYFLPSPEDVEGFFLWLKGIKG